jgi:hypothetical protein
MCLAVSFWEKPDAVKKIMVKMVKMNCLDIIFKLGRVYFVNITGILDEYFKELVFNI